MADSPPLSDAQMEHMSTTLDHIHRSLDEAQARLEQLPTKADLWRWKWEWSLMAVAAIATIASGIVGGLGWIKAHTSAIEVTAAAANPAVPAPR